MDGHRRWRLSLFVVPAFLSSCGDIASVGATDAGKHRPVYSQGAHESTEDDEFVRVAREEVDGFAGVVLDADGTPVVLVTPREQRAQVQRWAERQRGPDGSIWPAYRVRHAQFDFAQLRDWQQSLVPLLHDGAAFALDVDEAANRVWVAVRGAREAGLVRASAARLGIPAGALTVEVRSAPRPRAALTDYTRPLQGGLAIVNPSVGLCSYGFTALRVGAPVVVTASHCSNQKAGLDNAQLFQGDIGVAANQITSAEVEDSPIYICYVGTSAFGCRKADASAFTLSAGSSYVLGRIARTLFYGANQRGSTQMDPSNPYFQITSKNVDGLAVGTWVDKVGAVSGWTRGQVTRRCVLLYDAGIRFECQYVASTWSEPGDSGSPFFAVKSSGIDLHGVLWGGPPTNYGETWYSPVGGIEKGFGETLTVY